MACNERSEWLGITRTKDGRRNRYTINRETQLRHPVVSDLPIGPLVDALSDGHKPSPGAPADAGRAT